MAPVTENKTRVELRCPETPKKLLGAMRVSGEPVKIVDNLMELACRDCKSNVAAIAGKKPLRVLHYFNVLGECVESEVVWA